MHFDFLSFFIGLAVAGFIARLILWSDDCSLANRIAYNLLLEAQRVIRENHLIKKAQNPDHDFYYNPLPPIEDEAFLIQKVPELRVQTDVHIDDYTGVYSKQYNLCFLIEESYNCERVTSRYSYYLSDKDFKKRTLLKTPYDFNVAHYLKNK